jgi:hypothetical protein
VAFTSMSANMERGPIQRNEMQATDVASFLRRVQMPTVQHLLHASLEPTRAAIQATSSTRDPQQWVALHLILGTALRLRAPSLSLRERTEALVDSLHAFEAALAECWERKNARELRRARVGTNQFSLQVTACAAGPDGVQMVMDATSVSVSEGIEKLERAIGVFQENAETVDRRADLRMWVIARSNLGCAFTMLGQRTHGMNGVSRIERAVDVLRDAAAACSSEELREERASIHVNLAEAFQALAERAMPGERLRHIERSLDWITKALGHLVSEEDRWLLELDRAGFA